MSIYLARAPGTDGFIDVVRGGRAGIPPGRAANLVDRDGGSIAINPRRVELDPISRWIDEAPKTAGCLEFFLYVEASHRTPSAVRAD